MRFVFLSHLDLNLFQFRLPIMRALADDGHEVIALCPRGDFFDRFSESGIKAEEYYLCRKSTNILHEVRTIFSVFLCLSRLKPDVLHSFTIRPNIYGSIAGTMSCVSRIFCTVTGLGSIYIGGSERLRCAKIFLSKFQKFIFKSVQNVIFQNEDDLLAYLAWNIVPREKASLIRSSGVDTRFYHPHIASHQIASLRAKLGIYSDARIVLMVARAIWHKGLAEYIAAANQLRKSDPNVLFLLVGDIDEGNPSSATRDYLMSQPNLMWLGHRQDIAELTALCDVYVLPSYREGVPRTLLEAASMAKPIVTTDTVGCREVVEDGVNGFLVPVRDSRALADRIATLLGDSELRERMGLNGRAKAVREFDVKHVVRQYLDLYGVPDGRV